MAKMFIDQLTAPYDPGQFTDSYREALEQVVAAKLGDAPMPAAAEAEETGSGDVVDLVAALKASVEAAKKRRAAAAKAG